ncbi:MAG TPA: hypothetical protein VKF79_09105, partial [Candidatus Acidoferrum sp.]|nr:hypothetical protein [Candidatus Acidoferrum sp.]
MRAGRVIFALARADFLERVRRYSFFLTMLFALGLGYGAATGRISISMDGFRGVYTSAWIGSLAALITTCFVTLVGFYIIKSSVDRDRQTGVGQILAATPMSRTSYALGKFLSNFGVLASMVLVLAVCALVMQLFAAEDRHIDSAALVMPFLVVALPAIALTAAVAVLFEMLPVLRGGVGNVIWFFAWILGGLALPELTGKTWLDPVGIGVVSQSMMAAARQVIPGYKNGFALSISTARVQLAEGLRWHGVDWTAQVVGLRIAWFGAAIAIAVLAALLFDRFDPSRALSFSLRRAQAAKQMGAPENGSDFAISGAQDSVALPGSALATVAPTGGRHLHLSALPSATRGGAFGRLFVAELRLALQGLRWWWYAIAAGLLVAEFFAPLEAARGPLLGVAWLWPVLVWSAMGSRESRFATRALLFSCSGILARQLPACFLAGVAVAVLTGAGVGVRLAMTGEISGLAAWFAGAL